MIDYYMLGEFSQLRKENMIVGDIGNGSQMRQMKDQKGFPRSYPLCP